jgi:hypothetical protein
MVPDGGSGPAAACRRSAPVRLRSRLAALAIGCPLLGIAAAAAQTDEVQVYTGEINRPGQFSITLHDNYTPIGPKQPAFPGAIVPDHSLNGVPEYGLGVTDWLELGAYLPLYSVTREGRPLIDGGKLRALFVEPQATERDFAYGVNLELSYNARHWDEARYSLEIRPILGWNSGGWHLILNPIMDLPFRGGPGALRFAPAERLAYDLSEQWSLAIEHYADFGRFADFEPLSRQYHALYGVVDFSSGPYSAEFGIGHGFTPVSEALILKLILSRSF